MNKEYIEFNTKILNIIESNLGMCCVKKYIHLMNSVVETSNLQGDMVEMGCYEGKTSLILQMIGDERNLHVYDSFLGLPFKKQKDGYSDFFKEGDLKTTEHELKNNFKKYNVKLPTIHKGFFNTLTMNDIPEKISFAFLDGDFYDSVKDCLNLVYDRVVSNGIILVDDYGHSDLPGSKIAVDEFLIDKKDCIHGITNKIGMYKIIKL